MKTFLRIGVIFLFSLFMIQPASGQRLLKKLREKVEQKVNETVEKKAEEKVDEKIDEEIEKKEEANQNQEGEKSNNRQSDQDRMQRMLQGFGITGEPVAYEKSYNFDFLIQMHIESFDKAGNESSNGEFITHLDPKSKSMAYEVVSGDMSDPGQGLFIIDAENSAMIILSDDEKEKTGIVYGMSSFMKSLDQDYMNEEVDMEETPETYLANPNVTKTGRKKTIAGYKCEEYKYTDETSVSHYWITKDLKPGAQDFFATLFKASMYSHGMGWGYLMEVNTVDNESGEKTNMVVTRVDENSNKKFDLGSYQITNLGSLNIPTGVEE